MKIFEKTKYNGTRKYYLFGVKVFEYQKKYKLKGDLSDNKLTLPDTGKFNIQIFGKNNEVYINPKNKKISLSLVIYGDNNKVFVDKTEDNVNLTLTIGTNDCNISNSQFSVGSNCLINGLFCIMLENYTKVVIGNNCLFSEWIEFWASDTHSIFDSNGNLLNQGKEIIVGNNVWIGKDSKILKNTTIPDGCIVGMGSVVSKKFTTTNAILAGVPAKVVKENISWSNKRPNEFLK